MSRGPGTMQRAIIDTLTNHYDQNPALSDFRDGNLIEDRDGIPPSFAPVATLVGADGTRSQRGSARRAIGRLNDDGRVYLLYGRNRLVSARLINGTEDEFVWRHKMIDWRTVQRHEDILQSLLLERQDELAVAIRHGSDYMITQVRNNLKRLREQLLSSGTLEWFLSGLIKDFVDTDGGWNRDKLYPGFTAAEREEFFRRVFRDEASFDGWREPSDSEANRKIVEGLRKALGA